MARVDHTWAVSETRRVLAAAAGPLTITQIARQAAASRASIARGLRHLETTGHAVRVRGRHTTQGRTPDLWTAATAGAPDGAACPWS